MSRTIQPAVLHAFDGYRTRHVRVELELQEGGALRVLPPQPVLTDYEASHCRVEFLPAATPSGEP